MPQTLQTQCCIVGGGPAGIMAGFLLARAGIDVLVLEKHKDFFRDFRGDTIHPSTLQLLHELGLLDEFLQQPHQEMRQITAHFDNRIIHVADFTHLPTRCKFIAFMPQWDFLNFLTAHARKFPTFDLSMQSEVTSLLFEADRVIGVTAQTPGATLEVRANLVLGADGRSSTVRSSANLQVIDSGSPIDVLWFRLPRLADDPPQAFGFVTAGQFMVLINREKYWQCAFIIPKNSFPQKQQGGLAAFRQEIGRCVPFLSSRTQDLNDWNDIKLLSVKVDHLRHWHRDGLLCIGDSAHAMSPVGGVGINLAIQDAVAAANLLAPKLLNNSLREKDLAAVQSRRQLPARLTQRAQVFMHEHLLKPIFESKKTISPPLPMILTEQFPLLRRLAARAVGIGFRPEHITSPAAKNH